VNKLFINTIRQRREQLGLSQSALARLIGLAEPNLSRLELGNTKPWPKARRDLAKALGATENDLFPLSDSEGDTDGV
jgi:transcriptional regulator with XRE-family HTH domain